MFRDSAEARYGCKFICVVRELVTLLNERKNQCLN